MVEADKGIAALRLAHQAAAGSGDPQVAFAAARDLFDQRDRQGGRIGVVRGQVRDDAERRIEVHQAATARQAQPDRTVRVRQRGHYRIDRQRARIAGHRAQALENLRAQLVHADAVVPRAGPDQPIAVDQNGFLTVRGQAARIRRIVPVLVDATAVGVDAQQSIRLGRHPQTPAFIELQIAQLVARQRMPRIRALVISQQRRSGSGKPVQARRRGGYPQVPARSEGERPDIERTCRIEADLAQVASVRIASPQAVAAADEHRAVARLAQHAHIGEHGKASQWRIHEPVAAPVQPLQCPGRAGNPQAVVLVDQQGGDVLGRIAARQRRIGSVMLETIQYGIVAIQPTGLGPDPQ